MNELNSQTLLEISKKLEIDNFKLLNEVPEGSLFKEDYKSWVVDEDIQNKNIEKDILQQEEDTGNFGDKENTQFTSFQKAMKVLFATGQCLGLNPVTAILDSNISNIRFTVCSWIFLYTVLIATVQTFITGFYLHKAFSAPVISIHTVAFATFCLTTWSTTFLFIRVATKWESLLKEIFNCNLDKYVDPDIIARCTTTCVIFLLIASIQSIFEILRDAGEVLDCTTGEYNFYEKLMSNAFPLLQNFNQPYNLTITIILQILLVMMNTTYGYLDIFIICTSLYLASVLKQINKKILWAADKIYLLPSIWGTLREEYSRATRLVRLFDDVFSSLILVSFAMNLFLICLHLFNVLSNGVRPRIINSGACPNYPNGFLYGYEYPLYAIFTLTYLIMKFLTVSLVAASVNDASLVPVSALYKVPSCSYSTEVQRFLDQVHDDIVALSGMEYFYITKGLVLSVLGTILTYELVLLQFNIEESNDLM